MDNHRRGNMIVARPSYYGSMVAMALAATASSIVAAWYYRKQLQLKKAKRLICKKLAVQNTTTTIARSKEERPSNLACNSTASTDESAATLYPNPLFQPDKFRLCYERWKKAVGSSTLLEAGITEDSMHRTCQLICTHFPRGSHCGELLWDPVMDGVPLEQRGVSMQWLQSAFSWMEQVIKAKEGCTIPTRLFVALFVEPLLHHSTTTQREEGISLYYFVPLQFRGKPQVFLSHGWDSWLRQLLYWDSNSSPGRLAKKRGLPNTFLWLDVFAIVQDSGSVKQKREVAQIGSVVRSIGQTCLVLPGHGTNHFALLPARRSWCCLEIANSQKLSARVDINYHLQQSSDEKTSFHQGLIDEVCRLKCTNAETSNEDEKRVIQALLDQDLGLERVDCLLRRAILKAFYDQYSREAIYGTPCPFTIMYCQALGKIQ